MSTEKENLVNKNKNSNNISIPVEENEIKIESKKYSLIQNNNANIQPLNNKKSNENSQNKKFMDLLISYHIPIGLTFLIIWAIVWPTPGAYLSKTCAQTVFVCIIFFISGTQLKTNEVKNLVNHKFVLILYY